MKQLFIILLLVINVGCSSSDKEGEESLPDEVTSEMNTSAKSLSINAKGERTEEIKYWENGQVRIFGKFIDGKREGIWTSFFNDGKKNSETVYSNGEKSGKLMVWYSNGELFYQGYYEHNEKVGVWKFYASNGKFEKEVDYSKEK